MDPAGIREILLVRPYANNPYQFEALTRALPYKARFGQVYYSSIPWLPLFPPLTQRVSATAEGYAGYLQHDCLILAGTDPESFSERDLQHIRSAMERGLPTMICGGGYSLGNSYRLWHDLEEILPARVPAGRPLACADEVMATTDHPLLRGLPRGFGRVSALHAVEPATDAHVLLAANGQPVLVAGERFGSRQLLLTVAEADGLCCDGLDTAGFYGHPAYGDLMRRALSWLMRVEPPLCFDGLDLVSGWQLEEPGKHLFHVTARQEGACAGARLRCALYGIDEGRLMCGGDTVRTRLLLEEVCQLHDPLQRETFVIDDPLPGKGSGLYEVELSLEMDHPPSVQAQSCFAMSMPPQWSNWKGAAVDRRCFRLRFPDQRRTRVLAPGWTCTLEEGRAWTVQVEPPLSAIPVLSVSDATGRAVGHVSGQRTADAQELCWTAPPLTEGDYTARLTVALIDDREEEFAFALKAVAPPAPAETFQMVAHFPGSRTNEGEIARWMDDCLEAFGLDTLSLSGQQYAEALWDPSLPPAERPLAMRRVRWLDAMAAAKGRNLWSDFDRHLILLATHGASKTYDPTVPCVYHPDYEAAARAQLTPLFRLQQARAGLISSEIIDEPHLYASNVCRCDTCRQMYRERFAEEMPAWEEVQGDQTRRRWHFFQWMEEYTTRAFAVARQIKQEVAPELHIHNVAIDRLFTSNNIFNGMHRWAKYGDELYMACYPWSYLSWRGREQAPHSQTHWIAAWIRGLATHYGIPWGVFMELWENETPDRWMPAYWSVGQFYALLAAGCTRLDTFMLSFNSEMFGMSDARLREFGAEVNKVRPFFPLLARTARPRARMAFINPWCQWVMGPQPYAMPPEHEGYGYFRRYALPFDALFPFENRRMLAFELFQRTFSDLDQVDEQLLCEAPLDYQAIVISDCTFLMRETMRQLTAFVQGGGVLVLDCRPSRDESGAHTDFFTQLTSGQETASGVIVPGLSYRVFSVGQGHVLAFSASLQTTYADVLESERDGVRRRFEATVRALLRDLGVTPRWETDGGELDAGLRIADGVGLAPVANLCPETRHGRVTLRALPFVPGFAVNLTDGAFLDFTTTPDGIAFDVTLDGYHGALVALCSARPERCGVHVAKPSLKPGKPLHYTATLTDDAGAPLRGSYLLVATVTDSTGVVHRRLGGPVIVQDGAAQVEKRLPVNAVTGKWTIRLEDPIIGVRAASEFKVTLPAAKS